MFDQRAEKIKAFEAKLEDIENNILCAKPEQRDQFDKDKREAEQNHKKNMKSLNGFCAKASCATCALIPPDSVDISLDALYTIDIV